VPFYGRGPDRGGDTFSKPNIISGQWPSIQIKETGEVWKNPCALVLRHRSMLLRKQSTNSCIGATQITRRERPPADEFRLSDQYCSLDRKAEYALRKWMEEVRNLCVCLELPDLPPKTDILIVSASPAVWRSPPNCGAGYL
jgi:hypothetical protein